MYAMRQARMAARDPGTHGVGCARLRGVRLVARIVLRARGKAHDAVLGPDSDWGDLMTVIDALTLDDAETKASKGDPLERRCPFCGGYLVILGLGEEHTDYGVRKRRIEIRCTGHQPGSQSARNGCGFFGARMVSQ